MRVCFGPLAIAAMLAGCVQPELTGVEPRADVPYLAVQKPVPRGENRIYLLAAIPGKIVIANACVLFERMDGAIVLPVFENGTRAGVDQHGAWVFDPVSKAYFRNGSRVSGGGGGGGETVRELEGRHVLVDRVPSRCTASLTVDAALTLNPGIEPFRPG